MPHHVLVVDDEKDTRAAWAKALRYGGYAVTTAGNAQEALEACERERFDVAILDFIMPKTTGVELLAAIRKRLPLVRAVIVSGKLERQLSEEELSQSLKSAVEADSYLHKPVSNERLRQVVEGLLTQAEPQEWSDIAKRSLDRRALTQSTARRVSRSLKQKTKSKR